MIQLPFKLCVTKWHSLWQISICMMTSSNGNIFRVTGHLCGEFTGHRPVTWSFDVFFDLRLNKRLSKQSWCCWFETPWRSLWCHPNGQHWFRKRLVAVTHHPLPKSIMTRSVSLNGVLDYIKSVSSNGVIRPQRVDMFITTGFSIWLHAGWIRFLRISLG